MKKLNSIFTVVLFLLCLNSNSFEQDNVTKDNLTPVGDYPSIFTKDNLPTNHNYDGVGLTTVLPGNFSTSGNGRAPQGTRRFINTKYIISSARIGGSGFSGQVMSVGWRWNVPIPPAATAPTAQNVSTTGNLRVYLKDTVTGATTIGSNIIDTNGTGYTKVIDGTISIPAGLSEINIDVPVGGPGTGPYTPTPGSAVLLIFVYRTTDATLATPLGAPNVCCVNSPTNGLSTFQSNTTNGQTGTFSAFLPETRFGFTPANCDVAINNLNPTGTIAPGCNPLTVAPKANIFNSGLSTQTAITVTYAVPSESYSETVAASDMASGANQDVNFPNTLVLSSGSPGTKAVTITVNSTCDAGSQTYTLNTSFDVSSVNVNFGGPVGGYYWANSTSGASCAPDQPVYYWEDTTGSTSLILNGVNQVGALLTGTLDDGYFSVGNALDGGSGEFRYYGIAYDSFYIGTNGMIAFSRANNTQAQLTTFTPLAIPAVTAPRPAIFPFWKDFNFADVDVPVNRLSYKTATTSKGPVFIITYDRAPNFGVTAGSDDYASFQIILELTPFDIGISDNLLIVQYDDATTGSVFLTKYNAATLATHTVGVMDPTGTSAIQYRRATPAVVVAGPLFSSPVAVGFGPNQNVLPVELASFTSSISGRDVTLNWATATESNNSGFDIERRDARGETQDVWLKIGNVAGNGTTTSVHSYSFTDRNLTTGSHSYRLKQIDFNGNFEYFNLNNEVNVGAPTKFDLSQNYPNPFNPSTKINYDLPLDGKVSIKIFDLSGKELMTLVNEVKTAGYYTVNFNGSNLSSGIYFYSISAGDFTATKKLTLIK